MTSPTPIMPPLTTGSTLLDSAAIDSAVSAANNGFGHFFVEQNLMFIFPEIILLLALILGVFQVLSSKADKQLAAWRTMVIGSFFALMTLTTILISFYFNPMSGELLGFGGSYSVLYDAFHSDLFSTLIRWAISLGMLLLLLFSKTYMVKNSPVPGESFLLMVGASLGAMFISGANDLIMAFVGLETLGISSFILAGYIRNQAKSSEAALKYLLYGGVSTAVLLFGFSLLMGMGGGHTNFTALAIYLQSIDLSLFNPVIPLMLILIVGGLAFKLSAVPFHMWTPDIYEGSPTPVTAFLSVVSKLGALALVIRLMVLVFPPLMFFPTESGAVASLLFTVISVLSMTLGNLAALKQSNIKRMLAYSTIAHVGYMLLGFVILGQAGLTTLLFYMFTYLFMNLGAFAVVIHLSNEMGREDINAYAGLMQKRPVMTLFLTFFLLSLAGIPITAGFFAKFFLFQAVALAGPDFLWLVILALVNSTISLYYYLNVIRLTVVAEPSDSVAALSRRHDFLAMVPVTVSMVVCFVATVGLGIYAEPALQLVANAVNQLVMTSVYANVDRTPTTLSDAAAAIQ